MNFSITFPSRERVGLLTNLIRSIADTSADITNVEMLIGIDNDDQATMDNYPALHERYPFAKFFPRDRSHMLNNDYINWAYALGGSGRFIIACNDDALFETQNWDKIMLDKLNAYLADKPDGIVYGYVSDAILNRHGMGYSCFPVISRKAVEVLGWIMPPSFPSWNADIVCWRTYLAIGRICDLSEVMIKHISYHSNLRERDGVSHHVEQIFKSAGLHANYNVDGYIGQLSEAIAKGGQ